MRYPSDKLADNLHFLGMPQLLFKPKRLLFRFFSGGNDQRRSQ